MSFKHTHFWEYFLAEIYTYSIAAYLPNIYVCISMFVAHWICSYFRSSPFNGHLPVFIHAWCSLYVHTYILYSLLCFVFVVCALKMNKGLWCKISWTAKCTIPQHTYFKTITRIFFFTYIYKQQQIYHLKLFLYLKFKRIFFLVHWSFKNSWPKFV